MFDPKAIDAIQGARARWEAGELRAFQERRPERRPAFQTASGFDLARLYTPVELAQDQPFDYLAKLGLPGQYPYTRGPYPTMYRGQPWTMRQIAGFGTAAETNGRFKYLIAQGQTGISTDFDMPTLMGYDSDDPRSLGEVGREGVAVDVLPDMEALFEGIDLANISVSMTINPTAWILLAMFIAMAEQRGVPLDRLAGTTQADIVKEYIAQKEWIYPVRPSLRLVGDMIVYGAERLPRFNPVNVSGYHIREAGATAVQEAAFTLAAGIAYAEEVTGRGLPFDSFAPRLSFYFVSNPDFLEEIAKFRAARRVWARIARERFGARKAESMRLRFHCQTAGSSLTAREPLNNIARTALQALAAVLGGAQSLHTNGMDEALAIPSEEAMKVALRTQQIIADETGVANTIDALGGSYALESLTDQVEAAVWRYLDRIDDLGGTLACVENNFFQREIADAAYAWQQRKEAGENIVVGINKYRDPTLDDEVIPIQLHRLDPESEQRQIAHLQRVKAERDNERVGALLQRLQDTARTSENLMPVTIAAVKAHASKGEIVKALKEVWGTYVEAPIF